MDEEALVSSIKAVVYYLFLNVDEEAEESSVLVV